MSSLASNDGLLDHLIQRDRIFTSCIQTTTPSVGDPSALESQWGMPLGSSDTLGPSVISDKCHPVPHESENIAMRLDMVVEKLQVCLL